MDTINNAIARDYKLQLKPIVVLKRLDLLEHLNDLTEECLSELQGRLWANVCQFSSGKIGPRATYSETGDDDVQIIEVKPLPRKEQTKIELRRVKQATEVKKLRKKAVLSREIFRPTVKRITSETVLSPELKKVLNKKETSKRRAIHEIQSNTQQQISGIMDVVNDKLVSLKEREQKLMESLRLGRKKKDLDPSVVDELQAMAQLEPIGDNFNLFKGRDKKMDSIAQNEQSIWKPKRTHSLFFNDKVNQLPDTSLAMPTVNFSNSNVKPELVSKERKGRIELACDQATLRILQTPAKTLEEKYHILDTRDKLFQSRRDKMSDKSFRLVGTCPDLCPEKERIRRCYQAQLSPFEMVDYPRNTDAREEWMVKEYARSSADQDTPLPHDLRPPTVLQRTMEHLCRNIADRCETTNELLDDWYMFMWDRTRAIRKDLTHQDACSPSSVRLLEQCARFHIHCAERLVDQDLSVYDDKINTENLTKCLQTLKYMYNDLRSIGVICTNAPEFLGYSLLLNLNNPAIMTEVRDMPEDMISSEPIRFALDIITARETKNYIKFFKLVAKTTYLNCCIVRRYFSEMRIHAFKTILGAHCLKRLKPQAIPLLPLVTNLLFEGVHDCLSHLKMCQLNVEERDGMPVVILDGNAFIVPDVAFPALPSLLYIQEKKRVLLSEVIWGGPLSDSSSLAPPLQSSFTSSGEFVMDTLTLDLTEPSYDEVNLVEEEDVVEIKGDEGENDDQYIYEQEEPLDNDYYDKDNLDVSHDVNTAVSSSATTFSFASVLAPSSTAIFPNWNVPVAPPQKEKVIGNVVSSGSEFKFFSVNSSTTFKPIAGNSSSIPNAKLTTPTTSNNKEFTFTANNPPLWVPSHTVEYCAKDTKESNKIAQNLENITRIQKEEAMRREKEAEALRIEKERQQEEKQLREMLLAERKKKEQEEKEEIEKRKMAELEKEKKLREAKRQKAIKNQLECLRRKYCWWKVGMFARIWRQRAWNLAQERKMEKYLKDLAITYPPICSPELLNGNPLGAVIPNALLLKRPPTQAFRQVAPRCSSPGMSGLLPTLPLVHMGRAVAPTLKARVQRLYPDPNSQYQSCFPWKLLLCLPGEEETQVRLDTFLEMHFVENFNWKFGIESAQLVSCVQNIGNLELVISVRRVKGLQLLDGNVSNENAVVGTNSLLFFLTDDHRVLHVARQRLNRIRSLPGGAKIPLVIFVFGDRLTEATVRSKLGVNGESHVVTCKGTSQQSLVTTLSESLCLAADVSAPVPLIRSATLSSFLKTSILDQVWLRVEKALATFNFHLTGPEVLVSYYNQCLDTLLKLLLDQKSNDQAHLAPEFELVLSRIEAPLELRSAPLRYDETYCIHLNNVFTNLELPAWPSGPLTTTQDLNYRLHQYAKLIVGDKKVRKQLKWRTYCVIQRTLLWKGLDIYCDEDIEVVLLKFPWIQVFQEFSKSRAEHVLSNLKSDELVITYNKEEIQHFCYYPPLLNQLALHSGKEPELNLNESRPRPEKDSIILAYSKAIERLTEDNDDRSLHLASLSEEVAQVLDASAPLLNDDTYRTEDIPINSITPEGAQLKRGFDNLDTAIEDLCSGLEKRRKILEEMMAEITNDQ